LLCSCSAFVSPAEGGCRDVRPAAQSPSFASPKEGDRRKGDPTVAVRLCRTALRCSVWAGGCGTRPFGPQTVLADRATRGNLPPPPLLDATEGTRDCQTGHRCARLPYWYSAVGCSAVHRRWQGRAAQRRADQGSPLSEPQASLGDIPPGASSAGKPVGPLTPARLSFAYFSLAKQRTSRSPAGASPGSRRMQRQKHQEQQEHS